MAEKYRVAIIGSTGRGNYGHGLDTVWRQVPRCTVVAVADESDAGRAAAVKRLGEGVEGFADWRVMLERHKPEIVAIAPRWIDRHRDMAVFAAQRGIHIYMEKPFCRTPAEGDEVLAACAGHDVKLALAHQTRYSPRLQVITDMIAAGKIGQVLELRGRGKEDRRGGGEDLWVLGSHVMNLMAHFGGEPRWCSADMTEGGERVARRHVRDGAEGLGPLAGDHVSAMYGMDRGVKAYFASTRGAGLRGSRFGLQIVGSEGIIDLTTGYLPEVHWLADSTWSPGRTGKAWVAVTSAGVGKPEPLGDGGLGAGNVLAVEDLLQAIEQDRQPECGGHEGLVTVEMICGVLESHRQSGARVALPLANRQHPLAML